MSLFLRNIKSAAQVENAKIMFISRKYVSISAKSFLRTSISLLQQKMSGTYDCAHCGQDSMVPFACNLCHGNVCAKHCYCPHRGEYAFVLEQSFGTPTITHGVAFTQADAVKWLCEAAEIPLDTELKIETKNLMPRSLMMITYGSCDATCYPAKQM